MNIPNYVWITLIGFSAGIITGRISTSYKLFRAEELFKNAEELFKDAKVLLDRVVALRTEIGETYDKLKREGSVLREDNSPQD